MGLVFFCADDSGDVRIRLSRDRGCGILLLSDYRGVDLMFHKVTEHIYIRQYQHYTDRPNIGLICGSRGTLLYDAGNSEANVSMLKMELAEQGLPMPDYVVLSHWHWDHSFGAGFWNARILAGRETDDQLRRMQNWAWDDQSMADRISRGEDIAFCSEMIKREYPDRSRIQITGADLVFEGRLTVDLGDVQCRLIHVEGPHSSDSVICYVPSDRFVFLGDSNCKDLYGMPWHFDIEHEEDFVPVTDALPYDREKTERYLELLENLDFSHCVSGHADPMTKGELFRSIRESKFI